MRSPKGGPCAGHGSTEIGPSQMVAAAEAASATPACGSVNEGPAIGVTPFFSPAPGPPATTRKKNQPIR